MNFSHAKNFMLFGGGETLAKFSLNLRKRGYGVYVLLGERNRKDAIDHAGIVMSLEEFLTKHNIEFHVSRDVNKDRKVKDKITPETLGFSIAAPWIFKKEFLGLFCGGFLNIHGTQLPRYRGGGGISWHILQNNRRGFNLMHVLDGGIDTGGIIKFCEFDFPPACRTPEDYIRLIIEREKKFLVDFLEDLSNDKEFVPVVQQECFSTYWPRLSTEHHGFINWDWPLRDVEVFVCAFDRPYKGASTFINGKRVFLRNCYANFEDGTFHPFQIGLVYRKTKETVFIALREGSLIVKDARDEQDVCMIEKISVGDRFYTPCKYLETAQQFRVSIGPDGEHRNRCKS